MRPLRAGAGEGARCGVGDSRGGALLIGLGVLIMGTPLLLAYQETLREHPYVGWPLAITVTAGLNTVIAKFILSDEDRGWLGTFIGALIGAGAGAGLLAAGVHTDDWKASFTLIATGLLLPFPGALIGAWISSLMSEPAAPTAQLAITPLPDGGVVLGVVGRF